MKHISHPIIGDATHGKGPLNRAVAQWLGVQRLWLHASALTLANPVSDQILNLAAPPDTGWTAWVPHRRE
jgi:tRNA pseudouridine65 synthase